MIVTFTVNGRARSVTVDGWESLLDALRDRLGLRGAKDACEQGECGSCSVLLDGALVCSCLVMVSDAEGADIVTVEGLGRPGHLNRVQQALIDHAGVQCGFCTPGLVVAISHLLDQEPAPSRDDLREALAGNLCRCTGYGAILRAVESLYESEGSAP